MKHCNKCGVDMGGQLDKCPLCHAELSGKAEPSVFPRNVAKASGTEALKVLAFVSGACILGLVFLWQLIALPGDIVLALCLGLVMNYLFVRSILMHSPNFLRVVIRYFLILLAITFVWFLITQNPFVTTFIIPGICLLALAFDAVLVTVFRGTFVSGYAKYLLFDVFLGLTPLILVALGLTTWNVLAYTSAFVASLLFLALAIFMRKQLLAELRKLFST